jgi:hypothetical protein
VETISPSSDRCDLSKKNSFLERPFPHQHFSIFPPVFTHHHDMAEEDGMYEEDEARSLAIYRQKMMS